MKKEKPPVTYDTRYRYKLDMLDPGTIMLKWVGIFLLIGLALELPMEELRELLAVYYEQNVSHEVYDSVDGERYVKES